jgi:hypothetical protein
MADIKISALPFAGSLDGTELVPVVQSGVTEQTTTGQFFFQPGTAAELAALTAKTVTVIDSGFTTRLLLNGASGQIFVVSQTDNSSSARLTCTGVGGTAVAQMNLGGSFQVSLGFGANGATPQAKATVNAAAVDPATTMALVNQLRAALIANGICQ